MKRKPIITYTIDEYVPLCRGKEAKQILASMKKNKAAVEQLLADIYFADIDIAQGGGVSWERSPLYWTMSDRLPVTIEVGVWTDVTVKAWYCAVDGSACYLCEAWTHWMWEAYDEHEGAFVQDRPAEESKRVAKTIGVYAQARTR